ncbi:hypothetical protein [Sphingomonas sp. OV641]|uniref:hypothetical protein n=1 Tax=Sphingomonas sp. OV641 TaxID=1881068 RepID=UPI000B804ADA
MPIAPEHRWLYPIDWPELSKLIRFRRAKGRCEHCQRPHGRDVIHLGNGTWWDEDSAAWRDGKGRRVRALAPLGDLLPIQLMLIDIDSPPPRVTRVVLATAHLNHDPGDNRPRNLAALCQRCHMIHDAAEHRRRRWLNRYRLRAIRDLFTL